MNKAILVMALAILLVIPMLNVVSAVEWDNVKDYNPETKEVTISDSFLRLWTTDEIARVKLITEQHEKGFPSDAIFELEFTLPKDYDGAIDNFKFYKNNINGDLISNPDYTLKYYDEDESYFITENIYKEILDKNGTIANVVDYTNEIERKGVWKELNELGDLKAGTTRIAGFYSGLKQGEKIEWIPTLFGVEIEEWADFTGYTLQDHQYTANDYKVTAGVNFRGQSFRPSIDYTLKGLEVQLGKRGSPGDGARFVIFNATDDGFPVDTTNPLLNMTVNAVGIDGGTPPTNQYNWTFNGTLHVVKDNNYSLVLMYEAGTYTTTSIEWESNSGSGYPNGTYIYKEGAGAWTATGADMVFGLWGSGGMPTVTLNAPVDYYNSTNQNVTFNCSATGQFGSTIENITLWINGVENVTQSGGFFETTLQVPYGNNYWNCNATDNNLLESVGTARNFTIDQVNVNSINYNTTAYETSRQGFDINVTKGGSYSDVTANLWYNGTKYSTTELDSTSSSVFTYNTQSLPLLATENSQENRTLIWEFILDTTTFVNKTYYQIVNPINVTNCSAGVSFFNVTFKDEKTLAVINATTDNDWDYYLGNGDGYRTNTLLHSEPQYEYDYCFLPVTENFTVAGFGEHYNPDYPLREYNYGGIYSNDTTNIVVYLLASTDGIYTTFQVLSPADSPISGVTAKANTTISGNSIQVDSGTTGDDGGVTFWVNSDAPHIFTFSKAGYDDVTVSLTPTQSQYTVYMGNAANGTDGGNDFNRGIWNSINPSQQTLDNNTVYTFNYTLTSSYWDVEEFGFILRNSTTELSRVSNSTNGGSVITNTDIEESDYIQMDYYWVVTGNYSNATRIWYVEEGSSGYGLSTFFNRLVTYTDSGIFGLNNWSVTFIVFIIIFIIIGITAYTSGAYSPTAISIMLFGLVAFFDVVLGLIESPPNAINHFATVFTFFIMAILLIWEATK